MTRPFFALGFRSRERGAEVLAPHSHFCMYSIFFVYARVNDSKTCLLLQATSQLWKKVPSLMCRMSSLASLGLKRTPGGP